MGTAIALKMGTTIVHIIAPDTSTHGSQTCLNPVLDPIVAGVPMPTIASNKC